MWNTRHFERAQNKLAALGDPVEELVWHHLSAILWEHINLVGSYHFSDIQLEGEFRPLQEVEGRRVKRKKGVSPPAETDTKSLLQTEKNAEEAEQLIQLSLLQNEEPSS